MKKVRPQIDRELNALSICGLTVFIGIYFLGDSQPLILLVKLTSNI